MDGADRAAVLLLGIGEVNAAEVLKHLEPRQVQRVGTAMTGMANVSKEEIEQVVSEFLDQAEQQTSLGVDSEQYVRDMLVAAVGQERATSFLDRILSSQDNSGLATLKWLDARTIADLIRNEHPQIIATILMTLDSELSAEVLSEFPKEKHVDLVLRMSAIDTVKPEALKELGETIEQQLAGKQQGKAASIGGIKSVADIINHLDSSLETNILDTIKESDAALCESIQEKMFVFENLSSIDDRSIQTILREISSDVLLIALKGADIQVRDKIFKNMSKRAAELLMDDLDAKGPVKVSEVEVAQKEILAAARKLAEAGEISLGGKGGEEMI